VSTKTEIKSIFQKRLLIILLLGCEYQSFHELTHDTDI